MASNINPAQIDGNFPIAGQDNDTQGFRDNFTNIKTNLTFAKMEIDDLQSKVLLKQPLQGQTLTNDMQNTVLARPQLRSYTKTFRDLSSQFGVLEVNWLDGNVQKITLEGNLTIGFTNLPPSGVYASMRLWIRVDDTDYTLTLPNSVVLGTASVPSFNTTTKKLSFAAEGDYLFDFITVDGGAEFWIIKVA